MSELKAYTYDDMLDGDADIDVEYYRKDELDKVIAEKDEKIAELKEHNENYRFDNKNMLHKIMKQDAELRHQKYKRCLDMAKWCDETMMSCELRGYNIHRIWAIKHEWAMRWKYKWLELAEKFKPNN